MSDKKYLILPGVRRAQPRRVVRCFAFAATAALAATMIAQGVRVRRNVLQPWHYVAPMEDVSDAQFWELLQDSRFKFMAVVTFLVSPTGSNQTFSVPTTWSNVSNLVECVGSGGTGGAGAGNFTNASSGGSGATYAAAKVVLIPGSTATYQIAAIAAGVSSNSNGNNGTSSWFNGATFNASSVGAVGGVGGTTSIFGFVSGAPGGAASACRGTVKMSGGASGSATDDGGHTAASGGGGAGGPNGAGVSSANALDTGTAGGAGDNNFGEAGAGGAPNSTGGTSGAGGSGQEYDASHGIGGGSGGCTAIGDTISATSGAAGLYGAASGGAAAGGNSTGAFTANSAQGLIVVSFTPYTPAAARIVG
jgi:hypothetical protein